MAHKLLDSLLLAGLVISGVCMANTQQPRAGGLYILEATNASFASAQQVTLSGIAPATAYMVGYPYRDAGVLDTAALIQDPTFSPQNTWLAGPVGTLFGTGDNATAVLFLVNGAPLYDYPLATLTLNISVISDPSYLKFSDGIARQTYHNGVSPNRFARAVQVTAQVGAGGLLTNVALYLDVDQTQIVPNAVPAPGNTITNNNNNNGGTINNNNNGAGDSITNNNGVGPFQSPPTTGGGITNNNNNNNFNGPVPPSGGSTLTGFTTPTAARTVTNNNFNGQSGGVTNTNNNSPNGTPVPSAPGQVPAPGTYNVITVTSDCNGQSTTHYSYVPGLQGISKNTNNNCNSG